MNKSRNILICPLQWGLGHAGRMIPLAARLRELNYNIFIGSGEEQLSFFRRELPGLNYINFKGFSPVYSRILPQYVSLFLKTPVLIFHSFLEHFRLKRIIREHSIDIVISDNRFGLWNKKIRTVYITHMPRIPFPRPFRFLEFIGIILHRSIIKKYSLCFIPDLPGDNNLSGRLSHDLKLPGNTRHIGILSRFTIQGPVSTQKPGDQGHVTVILSGPEPQRSILKTKLYALLRDNKAPVIFLGGRPDLQTEPEVSDNITYFNHLPAEEMKEIITGSSRIITRSGYTTIMELISLSCNALLVPTPGQTEQEYLAEYLTRNGWFTSVLQKKLDSRISFPSSGPGWTDDIMQQSKDLLEKALRELSEEK